MVNSKDERNAVNGRMSLCLVAAIIAWAVGAGSGMANDGQLDDKAKWFRDAKYAMFIHWGPYSEAGGLWKGKRYYGSGEWIMRRTKPTMEEYEALAARFNPVKFDADQWVKVAKDAGMKYIVITAKHHDGFAMWHSKASKFNIVDGTPYDRDPLKELAEACRKAGITFCVYYSQYNDWHEPNAGGNTWTFKDPKDFSIYYERKCKPQIKELLTGYGPLGLIWFDQPGAITRAQSKELADMVHTHQPNCLVSNRIGHNMGDYSRKTNTESKQTRRSNDDHARSAAIEYCSRPDFRCVRTGSR